MIRTRAAALASKRTGLLGGEENYGASMNIDGRQISIICNFGLVMIASAFAAAGSSGVLSRQQAAGVQPISSGAEIVVSEFVFETAPFASAHASTIVETSEGLAAAWFGGTREGAADVGVWLSRRVSGKWTVPAEVANGLQPDGSRYPCWNPVLFEIAPGVLTLFYKVGPSPQGWWGMTRTSRDAGRTWS